MARQPFSPSPHWMLARLRGRAMPSTRRALAECRRRSSPRVSMLRRYSLVAVKNLTSPETSRASRERRARARSEPGVCESKSGFCCSTRRLLSGAAWVTSRVPGGPTILTVARASARWLSSQDLLRAIPGDPTTLSSDGVLSVPAHPSTPFIKGDGTGPDIAGRPIRWFKGVCKV
jgi:hypothetical protein